MAPSSRVRKESGSDILTRLLGTPDEVVEVQAPQQVDIGKPQEFAQNYPIPRQNVPSIQEELPTEAKDDSILGGFLNIMDNVVPDDMGGMVRGTSGWLSNVPGYQQTIGKIAGVPLSAAETAFNVMNWGSEQMNHLGAALYSALPGGIQTLDWEQAQDISLGQVVAANAAINNRKGGAGWLINAATLQFPFAVAMEIADDYDPDNILFSDKFDILDPAQRKQAFESGGIGQVTSGIADAVWLVAADPTIIGGKFTNIIRLGTKAGQFGGLTNQALRTATQVDRFATTVEDQARLISDLGVDGARKSGELTAEGENLIAAMEGKADDLVNHVWVKSSPNKRDTQALLGATAVERPEEAAALVGAMSGYAPAWTRLRELNVELYDATARALGVDIFAPVGSSVEDFVTAGVKLSDDQIRLGDDMVYEILSNRPELVAAGQLINRGGSRIGPRSVRAANAWRSGAVRNQFENNAFKKSSATGSGHFVYDTIEGIAGSRPVQVIRWLGQGTPTGIVSLKDGADGAESLNSVTAWLRKSPLSQERSSQYLNEFATARTVNERKAILANAEAEVVQAIAGKKGIGTETARKMYNEYARRRQTALDNVARSETNFYADPDTGKLIKVPDFYAELDQSFPLLDLKMFNRVVSNKSWLRYGEDVSLAADYLNSLWKVSVLLRLGYTQRNLLEGSMRSLAVLGLVAANPEAWVNLPANAVYYAKARKAIKGLRVQEKRLSGVYTDLTDARKVLASTMEDSGIAEIESLGRQADDIRQQIQKMARPGINLNADQRKQVAKMERERQKLLAKQKKIRVEKYEPRIPELVGARRREAAILAEIDDLSTRVLAASDAARTKMAKRKIGGRRSNIMDDGTVMPGAFEGQDGAIAALASSADRTAYMTFDAAVGRRIEQLENSADFRRLDPAKLKPEQMQTYFDEYAIRVNHRYRSDPVGRMILENRPVDEIFSWLTSPAGNGYRQQMSVFGRRLENQQDVLQYIDHLVRRLDNEMPRNTKLRELALDHDVTPGEIMAALRGRDLPVIVGRVADEVPSGLFQTTVRGINKVTEGAMRALGSIPETKMLRHPFYKNIFDAEQKRMWRLASDQGVDVSLPLVQNRISKAAHRAALKATKETMYTIDQLSNAAVMLRFISPFFPAWENSMRTWGRIVWNNPAVAGYGNLMWNIPNNLGLVVDKNGNPVEKSNMLRDEGNYIVWPAAVQEFLKKDLGPLNAVLPGEGLRTPQQAFNVVLPGAEWWFAGLGPSATVPTAWFLRGKPEDAEVLRNVVGDEMFKQIVPGSNPNADLFDAMLPTVARRFKQMLAGESTDSAYIRTYNQIIEDEYIAAQLENRTLTDADMKRIKDKAERFWAWQIGAAGLAPVQSQIVSRYQVQRDAWARLIDDESIPYSEKVRLFTEQYPGFDAITRSESYSETKLQPNLETWKRITKNKDVVDKLYAIDPEVVGMFGNMGSFDEPFSYAVYGEYGTTGLGPEGTQIRRRMTPDEIVRNNEIKDGWKAFWLVKDAAEQKVIDLGYSSLQVKEASDIRDAVDKAAEQIAERYPAWGEERKIYTDKLPAFIQGARIIVQNAELVNEDSTIAALNDYLQIREGIVDALSKVNNDDARDAIKQAGYAAAWQLRQRDIGFADFYDQYLDRDDFRKV